MQTSGKISSGHHSILSRIIWKRRIWVCLWKSSFREGKYPLKSFFQVTLRDISPNHQRAANYWNVWSLSREISSRKKRVQGQGRNEKCIWQRMQPSGFKNQRPKVTGRISTGSLRWWKVDTNWGEIKIPIIWFWRGGECSALWGLE